MTSPVLWRLPHEFALCSLQFRFALRVSVMFHCVEPHPQKNVKPNKRTVSTESTRIAIILNPPAGPLRRSSQNVQAHPEVQFFCGKKNTHPSYFEFVFVLFVSSCVSLVAVRKKWVMD